MVEKTQNKNTEGKSKDSIFKIVAKKYFDGFKEMMKDPKKLRNFLIEVGVSVGFGVVIGVVTANPVIGVVAALASEAVIEPVTGIALNENERARKEKEREGELAKKYAGEWKDMTKERGRQKAINQVSPSAKSDKGQSKSNSHTIKELNRKQERNATRSV